MADFTTIKTEIDANIVPFNDAQEITGEKLNTTLQDLVDDINAKKSDPVTISQNTQNGGVDVKIGGVALGNGNVASQGEFKELNDALYGVNGNVFTIPGKRYTRAGVLVDYSDSTATNILPLSIFDNPKQNGIRIKSGRFRMYGEYDFCVAVFFDGEKSFIDYSQLRTIFSTVSEFPADAIPSNAEYVAFTALTSELSAVLETVPGLIEKNSIAITALDGKIEDVKIALGNTDAAVAGVKKFAENGIGGVLDGYDVFNTTNIFTITGKARSKTTGELYDYSSAKVSPLIALEYLRNSNGDIGILQGTFRGSSLGVAFFYDADGNYLGYDGSTTTYSTASAFPSENIIDGAFYVSFLQYNSVSQVVLYTYNKPMSQIDNLKARLDITTNYPVVVTPNMTPRAFYDAVRASLPSFAETNHTYMESFFAIESFAQFDFTWANVLDLVSKNLRQHIGDENTPMNIVCDNVNRALTERVFRFYDAKPLSNAERDASISTGLNKGEPSAIVSDDGGTLYIYANGKRISTNDGVSWTLPEDIIKSDSGNTLHEGINYIDGLYYLIAPRSNSGGILALYTSVDGLNFTYKGKLFDAGINLDGAHPVVSWGNPYLIKNYGDGKFYLYIETKESGFSWRIHLVIYDDFTTENEDGTIGAREIYSGNPVLTKPFEFMSLAVSSAGNADFCKGSDNRPIKYGNKYYMLFHSTYHAIAHILRASSLDLIHWNVDGIMWDNRDKPSGGDATSGNADACVVEFKGRTYLFYTWDINNPSATNYIKYTIDDRPMSELLKLYP